jgi:leader peptidase (prepilin peptidase) / N-methyltransferase
MAFPFATWLWPVLAAPFVGSFLGVLIRRLPVGRGLVLTRSACESCGRALAPWDLVPLASWLALRGRCRACGAAISWFHPAVELAATAVALSAAWTGSDVTDVWCGCLLGWTLLALAWIDWDWLRLPDALTLPLIVAGLVATWLLDPAAIADHAGATLAGYAALRGLNALYRRLRGRDGLGAGDAKLLAAGGAWVGLAALPWLLLLAALAGLGVAALRRLRGERLGATTALPFGTCLAAALWLAWLAAGPGG